MPKIVAGEEMLTLNEASRLTGLSYYILYQASRAGLLPVRYFGTRTRYVARTDALKFAREGAEPVSSNQTADVA